MANVTLFTGIDFLDPSFLDLSNDGILSANSGSVVLDYGDGTRGVFLGNNFTFSADPERPISGGTATGYEERTDGGDLLFRITGASIPATTVQDLVIQNRGADLLNLALAGADTIIGSNADDVVTAADGGDVVYGVSGADTIIGEAGNDSLFGNRENDSIRGGDGDDSLKAQVGNDSLLGESGNDLQFGGGGNDIVDGGIGNDVVNGNSGADTVIGGDGNDTVRGQGGADNLSGGSGNDSLQGIFGFDTLDGGSGNDTLIGGEANDTLTGGSGVDVFVFTPGHAIDVVTDFADNLDKISMAGVAGLGALTIVDTAAGARVSFAADPDELTVTFNNITANQLTASDFFFS